MPFQRQVVFPGFPQRCHLVPFVKGEKHRGPAFGMIWQGLAIFKSAINFDPTIPSLAIGDTPEIRPYKNTPILFINDIPQYCFK